MSLPTPLLNTLKRLFFTFVGCFLLVSVMAQSDREFWFAAPEVTIDHGDNPVFFRITAYSKDATVTISQPANPNFTPIVFTVLANQTYSIDFTPYLPIIENKPGNTALNYGILISSTTSISAYYEITYINNPEIFPLKGSVSKGIDFIIPAQTRFDNSCCLNGTYGTPYSFPAHNGFAIIATEDNTQVDITLTNKDEAGHLPGVTYTVYLNKGQTYAVNAINYSVTTHLGGSEVKSNKPICVTIYDDSIVIIGWDLIGDQIVPINNTGKKFIVVKGVLNYPVFPQTDFIYIWPTENNTEIFINGIPLTQKFNKGQHYELLLSDPTAYITTDKPVYVFQLTGTGTEAAATSLPSAECTGSQSVSFVRPNSSEFYLNLFCKSDDIGSFLINGTPGLIKSSMFSPVNGTNNVWQYARIDVSSIYTINNLITTTQATSVTNSTGLFHLGFLNTSSGGSRLGYFSNYAQVVLSPVITSTTCFGSEIKLSAIDLQNVNYKWSGPNNFSSTIANPTISNASLLDSGMYVVEANVNGCGLSKDSVLVKVNPKPTIDFIKSTDSVCIGSTKDIHYKLNGKAPWTLEYSNGISNTIISNIAQSPNYFTIAPTTNTIYSIINIKDSNSCVVTDNINNEKDTMFVNKLPVPDFDIATIKCEQRDLLFSDNSKADLDNITHWYWSFGNGTIRNEITNTPFNEKYNIWGNYQIKLAVQSSLGCKSDTLIKSIYINPNPTVGFEMPEVCLNDKYAQFKDTSFLADHSVNSFNYLWNFNLVPPAGKKLPTIPTAAITDQNPIVQYNDFGDYQVSLKLIHKITGCESADTSHFRVNGAVPKAQFKIINDTALCSNQSVKIIDTSWVDFGDIGKLVLNWGDGAPDSVVNDPTNDPTIHKTYEHYYANISAPSHLNLNYPITLTAFSGVTCFNKAKTDIKIVPPPEIPIIQTQINYLCLKDSMNLIPTTNGGLPVFSYLYTSENPNASIIDNKIIGLLPGEAQLSIQVTDSKKCVYPFQNNFKIQVVDLPVATISVSDTVICNGDSVSLTGNGPNAIFYNWFRNDTLVKTTSMGSYRHNTPGSYQITMNNGQCNSLLTPALKIASFNITKYSFTTNPSICIGIPLVIHTDAIDQYSVHYNWTFGDGANYLKANPGSHKFLSRGDYTIKLNVTNDYCPKYYYQAIGKTVKVLAAATPTAYKLYFLANQEVALVTKIDPGYVMYKWSPGTYLSNNNIPNPIFKGEKSVDYTLTRTDTVTSCTVTDEYEIIVTNEVYVSLPNAFTPNNDGLNDKLKVEYSAGVTGAFSFKVFNRWGQILFQTNDINNGWDGRNQKGVMQEMDGYSYLLEYHYKDYKTGQDIPVNKTGSFILMR
ncbi:MAG: PKD domain-containing protein [Chitinophagia bacterium]